MKATIDDLIHDFLVDDDFILYVIDPDTSLSLKWDLFFKKNPDKLTPANKARTIIEGNFIDVHPEQTEITQMKGYIWDACKLYANN